MFSSADANVFTSNNFVDNLSPLALIGKNTTTRWQENGRGNYWSDYDGYDLDGDGIGDVPHKVQNVFEYMEGNYPRLRIYLDSPAAQALATAEKTFPVLRGSSEVDRAPLIKAIRPRFAVEQTNGKSAAQAPAMALAFVLFVASAVVIWRGQRR